MITILCAGSRGDYQPYIALAQELIKLGKEVRITSGKSFEAFIKAYGVEVYPIHADLETAHVDPKLLKAAGSADNPLKMLLAFNKMKDYGLDMADDYYNACVGSELIIYHPGVTMGYFAAQKLGIPAILASPFPLHKTQAYLSVVLYGKTKPNGLTLKLSYAMLQGMLWLASSTSVKSYWKTKFGKLPEAFSAPYERHNTPSSPAIISCSNHIFERPSDWNRHIHQEGYWFVEEPTSYTPSKALEDFLAAGSKPIYIGFGSMSMTDQLDELGELAVAALKKIGRRGILSGMGKPQNMTEDIFIVDSIPHTWLFEQVSVVCHHGGAGTSAAGFRAGVPSVIIPFSNDQFAWANRAYDLGIGSKPIPKKQLTADALANAILLAEQSQIVDRARLLGSQIKQENGAFECAKIIINCLKP